ncbi:MAG: hypothetical protein M3R13_02020 [Armatimonadota bacterium]|nr:hypothetical protein [Armatimonadota bacterium]
MKRLSILFAGLALFAAALASVTHQSFGRGVVAGGSYAGSHFHFHVEAPEDPAHENFFRFSDQGMFIPVEIAVPHILRVEFNRNSVFFVGRGTYNRTTPVVVTVTAIDGGPRGRDFLRMAARDESGAMVHSADGHLTQGDIVVRHSR